MAIGIVRLVNKLSIYIQFSNQFRWICHLVLRDFMFINTFVIVILLITTKLFTRTNLRLPNEYNYITSTLNSR